MEHSEPKSESLSTAPQDIVSTQYLNKNCLEITNENKKPEEVLLFLESITVHNEGLALFTKHKVLLRKCHRLLTDKVKIISGGPAGMAPLHSGFVGPGMLTAAVFGDVKCGPPFYSILAALKVLGKKHSPGVLVIVMNNLAERLTFGLACQQAALERIKVMCVFVGEDCSGEAVSKVIGRRGLCGVLFLIKVAGAMAEENRNLFEIYYVLTALNGGSLGTINAGIAERNACSNSGLNFQDETFEPNSIPHIVKKALTYILHPDAPYSLHIGKDDKVAVIVNNLGRLTDFQLSIVTGEVIIQIRAHGIDLVRVYSGRFLTSNDTKAFSVSILKIKENTLKWLAFPVSVTSWPNDINNIPEVAVQLNEKTFSYTDSSSRTYSTSVVDQSSMFDKSNLGPKFELDEVKHVLVVLKSIIATISNLEEHLNKFDYDGNYGTALKMFMASLKNAMDQKTLLILTPYGLLSHLAELAATTMTGISGGIFSVLFCSAAQSFILSSSNAPVCWCMWIDAAALARDALCNFIKVDLRDNTVYDALHPFVETFKTSTFESFNAAVEAATRGMEDAACCHPDVMPDPGAYAIAVTLRTILTELQIYLREEEILTPCQSLQDSLPQPYFE